MECQHEDCGDDPEGKGKHSPGHPHCNPDTGSTNDGNLYDVSVSVPLRLDSIIGHDGVGNKESVSVNYDFVDMDLSFFQVYFGYTYDGFKCFSAAPVAGRQAVLFIGHDKKGELEATYTFSGYGTDGTTRIGYRLKLSTDAEESGWRPTGGPGDRSDLTFNKWALSNKNDIACIDSGDFGDFGTSPIISIILR